ncbi:uncharacterized protein LOC124350150 isoform X2 [Daphnia pulicaria]|uniref:uncharacterized protein LOC124350150 isoform X2 n=1 Tax=Daphnia pulicaria TaxID=35523 RepID=UPI001EECB2C9|nr:uncharacterized protein LOC124350150 isoform X2 [Daphnia pulicaria]
MFSKALVIFQGSSSQTNIAMVSIKMSFLLVVSLFVLINFTDFVNSSHPNCRNGFRLNSDDTCLSIADKCGISLSSLYHHNGLTAGGLNCHNLAGHFLCCTNWTDMPNTNKRRPGRK